MTTDLENAEQTTIEPSQATMTGQQWLDYLAKTGQMTDNWLVRLKEAERAFTGHSNVAGVMRGHGSKDTAAIAANSTSSLNQIRSMVSQIDKSMDALQQTYDRYDDYLNAHSTSNIRNRTVAENRAAHKAQRASMSDEEKLATAGEAALHEVDISVNSQGGVGDQNLEAADENAQKLGEDYMAETAAEGNAAIDDFLNSNAQDIGEDYYQFTRSEKSVSFGMWTELDQKATFELWKAKQAEAGLNPDGSELDANGQNMTYQQFDSYLESIGRRSDGSKEPGTNTRISSVEAFPDNDEMQRDFGPAASLKGIDSELVSANPNMSLDADGELRQNTVVVTPSGSYIRTPGMDAGV